VIDRKVENVTEVRHPRFVRPDTLGSPQIAVEVGEIDE
jgi:hypothetical protein